MPKTAKRRRKKGKRGPKEERLKISEHPQAALDRLLKKPTAN